MNRKLALGGASELPLDPRVQVNEAQVLRVAKAISTLSEAPSYPWVGPTLPPAGHPKALGYLLAVTPTAR